MKRNPLGFQKSAQSNTDSLTCQSQRHEGSAQSHSGSVKHHLVSAAAIMGLMTLLSRILGMVRDIVSANSFGTSWQWDAFIYAFMLPNFFRRVVGEGGLTSAFIPIYSEKVQKEGKVAAFRYANIIGTLLGAGLIAVMMVLQLLLNWLLTWEAAPKIHLTLDLLRVFFPYLWFMAIYAWGMAVLNCHKSFFAAALGPVILDIFWIAGVLWVIPAAGSDIHRQLFWLSWVILLSGLVQVLVEWPTLYKIGFRFRWIWDIADQGVKRAWKLLLPTLIGFTVFQINILVDSTLCFWIGAGANSALWYGTRLMQFPLGVFAISMGTALLPTISQQAAAGEMEQAKKSISFALRSIFFIILPCSVGLIVMRVPIVQLLFERGEFDTLSTVRTANVLLCYAIGLFAYSGQKIISAAFYSIHDTSTPVKTGVFALILNVILNLLLMGVMAEAGLALATSIAGIAQFLLLLWIFEKKVKNFPFKEIGISFFKVSVISFIMGFFAWIIYEFLGYFWPVLNTTSLLIRVFGSISAGVLIYFIFCFIFRVQEMQEAFNWIRRRKNKSKTPA